MTPIHSSLTYCQPVTAQTGVDPSGQITLTFIAAVPPTGFSTYFIARSTDSATASVSAPQTFIANEFFNLNFDPSTNLSASLTDLKLGKRTDLQQTYLQYDSSPDSNPYIFLPRSSTATSVGGATTLVVTAGPVYQQAYQVPPLPRPAPLRPTPQATLHLDPRCPFLFWKLTCVAGRCYCFLPLSAELTDRSLAPASLSAPVCTPRCRSLTCQHLLPS